MAVLSRSMTVVGLLLCMVEYNMNITLSKILENTLQFMKRYYNFYNLQ